MSPTAAVSAFMPYGEAMEEDIPAFPNRYNMNILSCTNSRVGLQSDHHVLSIESGPPGGKPWFSPCSQASHDEFIDFMHQQLQYYDEDLEEDLANLSISATDIQEDQPS